MPALLEARSIIKRYGGTEALRGVDFSVEGGKVNVLIGENGAGKSTLMKIIAGVEEPTSGELMLDGAVIRLASVRDAAAVGIGMVHQELNLCPNLSVAENIFLLGSPSGGMVLHGEAEIAAARSLLAKLGQDIDPARKVESLSIGEQQIVEIAKALSENCRILIFDEPTSALSEAEVDVLFKVIGDLKAQGVGIVYISHRLEELLRVGDNITILRDGMVVARRDAADASVAWIVSEMLGSEGQLERVERRHGDGETVLAIEGVTLHRAAGSAPLHNVSLCFGQGSVVGIYGLLGSGRTELLEAALGARQLDQGRIVFQGEDVTDLDIAARVERGLLFVPEDRKAQGLFANLSVRANMALSNLGRFAKRGVVSTLREGEATAGMSRRLGVKAASDTAPIGSLSGGNQQKVLIGRALLPGPAMLLLDEPSRGVDVGARAELFATIRSLAEDGLAVAFTTSDLSEALAIADRILVIADGRLTLDILAAEANEATLVTAANALPFATPAKSGTL